MKNLIILFLSVLSFNIAFGQENVSVKAKEVITDHDLDITYHKTTILIFPAAIQDADRGDSYILAERAEGVENVLKLKAAEKDFVPSNLHVITQDGKVYAFSVRYNENPSTLTFDMGRTPPHSPVTFPEIALNSKELEFTAAGIKGIPPFISKVKKRKHGMELRMEGIFVKNDVLFFKYNLKNHTQLTYDTDAMRFYIRDKKRAKRTAVQDTEKEPVFVQRSGSPESDIGQTIIVAFSKFSIAESKYLVTEIMELEGDRNMDCRIDQKKLLQAKELN